MERTVNGNKCFLHKTCARFLHFHYCNISRRFSTMKADFFLIRCMGRQAITENMDGGWVFSEWDSFIASFVLANLVAIASAVLSAP